MPPRRARNLTRLESEVMAAIWDAQPGDVCVRDVLERLNQRRRRRKLAYNTIQTIMTILRDKGVVDVVGSEGRAHTYRARVSRHEASRHMVGDLVDRLFDGRVQPLLHLLIDDARLDPEELRELRTWVDQRLRDRDTARGDGKGGET